MDGMYADIGADDCNSAYLTYRGRYTTRMSATGGISPVSIANATYLISGNNVTISATYRLEDPVTLGAVQATLYLAENGVYYDAAHTFNHLARNIYTQAVTLANVGDEVTVQTTFPLGGTWNTANLEGAVILQKTSGSKEIIQAARAPLRMDFAITMPVRVHSVPEGSGEADFAGTLKNTSTTSDVVTLSFNGAFGWPAAFQVAGDPAWYTSSHPVTVAGGDSVAVTVRVTTDTVKAIGTGALRCQSAASSRYEDVTLRVFNLANSVLLVDDDETQTHEASFIAGLDQLGYLYQDWDVSNGHAGFSPELFDIAGYDVIIWQTGNRYTEALLNDAEIARLETYLDAGGRLYLDSPALMGFLGPPNPFTVNYLGVASRTNYTMATSAVGVPGDPITAGMSMALTFASGENRTARINPTPSATAIFFSQVNLPIALRNVLAGGGRTVFSTILQDAFPQSGVDPNNSASVIDRTLTWLLENTAPPSSVSEGISAGTRLTVVPNPVAGNADVRFNLASASSAGTVELAIVDVTGRQVRNLVSGRLTPGLHSLRWNGTDNDGRALPSGVYFARLRTADGAGSQKFLVTR